MKTFIYSTYESKYNRRTGSSKVTLNVFEVIKNVPKGLGYLEYSTGSTKGETSEVYDFLLKEKKVKPISGKTDSGYYRENKLFQIIGV